jgi:NAD(P)-dependent dehydrogenase (short-subunit alcohol dehydrogenase family)
MRILVIGAGGPVGKAAIAALRPRHDIVTAGRSSGDLHADLGDTASLRKLYADAGPLDAVICCAGNAAFAPLAEMTEQQFMGGLATKLMGQVNLVLIGQAMLRDGGSFTLTSGSLDRYPVRRGSNAAAINAGLGGFVKAAALDLPRGLRINLVSPTLLEESAAKLAPALPGHEAVPSWRVGLAYVKSVEGALTGQTIEVG